MPQPVKPYRGKGLLALNCHCVQGIPTVQRAVINKTLIKDEKDWAVPGNINTKDDDKKEFT